MKNIFASFFFVLALVATHAAQAQTIRRVNNSGITGTNIFSDVAAALAASAAGDIIQVEPSETAYGLITLDKNVTIVGPGYFLAADQNAGLQANPLTATISQIDVVAGGESATVTGLTVNAYTIKASNVTVQRCSIGSVLLSFGSATVLTNITVRENYIRSSISSFGSLGINNLLITNNVIGNISFPNTYNGGFFNNVVTNSASLSNFFIASSYFGSGSMISGTGNTLNNNIGAVTSFPTTNGNQANVPQSAVFVLAPGATAFDAWYQLKAGTNPARGTGQGGVDVGAFGGTTPYKLSGIPAIPAIYQQTETIVGNSLNATLSTRSNN